MQRPFIEFCMSNLASGSQRARAVLEKDPNLDVVESNCLSYCGHCDDRLYALVEGEIVTGEEPENLVNRIYEFLEENLVL